MPKAREGWKSTKEDRNQNTPGLEKKKEGVKLKSNKLLLFTVLFPGNFNAKLTWVVLSVKDPGAMDRSSGSKHLEV